MLPLKDENPSRHLPIVNLTLIGINILVFIYELGVKGNTFFLQYGIIPYELTHNIDLPPTNPYPVPFNFLSSMFIHGGFMHLFGNMLYLWIFGDNIEDKLGHFRYLVFYLLTGSLAAITHIFFTPNSQIPTVGASGAISGVLGGYFLLFPRTRILTLIPTFFGFYQIVRVPAVFVLGGWFILQFFNGFLALSASFSGGGVAWFAHLGGFLAGFILIRAFLKKLLF